MLGFQRLGPVEAIPVPYGAALPGLVALANRPPTLGTLGRNADTLQALSLDPQSRTSPLFNADVM